MRQGNKNGTQVSKHAKPSIKYEYKRPKAPTQSRSSKIPKTGGVRIGEYR